MGTQGPGASGEGAGSVREASLSRLVREGRAGQPRRGGPRKDVGRAGLPWVPEVLSPGPLGALGSRCGWLKRTPEALVAS